MKEKYIEFWKESFDINSNEYNRKLITYRIIKEDYKIENYLLSNANKEEIRSFTKIRISDSKLMIEKGRHKKVPKENRKCPLCTTEIEDEFHFVIHCRKLHGPDPICTPK